MPAGTRGVAQDGDLAVRFPADNFVVGCNISTEVIRNAMNPLSLLVRIWRHEENTKALQELNALIWLQIDPEKPPDWSLPSKPSTEKRKYYGDQ